RRAFAPSATWSESAPAPPGMLSLVKRLKPAGDDPRVLWLRPEWGYGDHLMLTAILAGLKAEHPTLRIRLAAAHPEIFWHNPHVEEVLSVHRLGRKHPERLARYLEVVRRPPEARYLQVSGHLLDDMYDCIGIPLQERPRQPYIYLTKWELRFRGREVEALPRPRIAIAAHGAPDVKLPNKVYPAPQWLELVPLLAPLLHASADAAAGPGGGGSGPRRRLAREPRHPPVSRAPDRVAGPARYARRSISSAR